MARMTDRRGLQMKIVSHLARSVEADYTGCRFSKVKRRFRIKPLRLNGIGIFTIPVVHSAFLGLGHRLQAASALIAFHEEPRNFSSQTVKRRTGSEGRCRWSARFAKSGFRDSVTGWREPAAQRIAPCARDFETTQATAGTQWRLKHVDSTRPREGSEEWVVKSYLLFLMSVSALCFLSGCGGSSGSVVSIRALAITSGAPPSGTQGVAYNGSQGFSPSASGGTAPYMWSWAAAAGSSLPPGLSLSTSTGAISGTPTAAGHTAW